MLTYSPAITLIWQLAAIEAAYAKTEFIEREQLFIGLLKAGDVLKPEALPQMESGMVDIASLREELDLVNDIFTKFGADRVSLRRCVRTLIGRGNFDHRNGVVHRSLFWFQIFSENHTGYNPGGSRGKPSSTLRTPLATG